MVLNLIVFIFIKNLKNCCVFNNFNLNLKAKALHVCFNVGAQKVINLLVNLALALPQFGCFLLPS